VEYVVTGAFVAIFVWAAYRALHLHLRGLRTTGTIIDIVEDKTSDGPVFSLVVRFTTSSGTTVEAKSHFGTEGVESYYRIGERVTIMYSAKNPQVFAIEGYDIAGVFLLFLMAAGACAVLYFGFIQHGGRGN
jgi:hypothetical protein